MSYEKTSQDYENHRLEVVLEQIGRQLVKGRKVTEDMKLETISIQKSMRDNINPSPKDLNDLADIWQFQTDLEREGTKAIFAAKRVAKLERMQNSPYFGRLDFQEEGETANDRIYIGVMNLADDLTHEQFVYDWRAPISSMFYDYETGRAGYDCPIGRIEGNIDLKRQYRIWQGKLELMFDCSLAIDDDILQEILSKSADSKMKTIVTSIQREQNKVIRNDKHRLLIVHGPAGSGKTSIALHRAAYLLYRYSKDIKAENIAIFSPNSIFSDYISDVLPELGEENIRRTTFLECARNMLGKTLEMEDPGDMMEYILTGKDDKKYEIRTKGMEYKSSESFMVLLHRYAGHIEDNWSFEDVIHDGTCIETKDEIDEYFRVGLKFLPISKRLDKIKNRLISKIDPLIQDRIEELVQVLAKSGEYPDKAEIRGRSTFIAREEFKAVRETVERMTRFDAEDRYIRLFKDTRLQKEISGDSLPDNIMEISKMTIRKFERGEVFYEDIAPFLYLAGVLAGITSVKEIKHIIVDEVQDYTVIQLEMLHKLFRDSSLTLLGDPSQSINPFMGNVSTDTIADIFGSKSSEIIRLGKSYRSTKQITAFCRSILASDDEGGYMEREGTEPSIVCKDSAEELYESVRKDICSLSESGCRSIAVICRTTVDSREAYGRLSEKMKIGLVSGSDEEYVKGISVIPSYLSKGLEFDAVLILCTDTEDYSREIERKLLYTVCTRALHRLNIYCLKQPVALLRGVTNNINVLSL